MSNRQPQCSLPSVSFGHAERSKTMAKVKMETKLNIPADTLWKTIGGFNALPDWHPAGAKSEATGELKGSTRTLNLGGGGTLVERLEGLNATDKPYRYSVLSGPP